MKTLKKVLSVALVIAMAFSLVTMVGAAGTVAKYQDFTDADAIVNKEAVDTLVGLGVINGMDDGSYAPNGHFTRAQASKIIAYLLLGDNVAASLRASSAPFADVAATHWAAPFIQFCVTRGILNGVGDNKFDPEGSVTAAQFAKMLLTAAGYGKKGEYVGADWAINTIVDAQNVGILDTGVDYMAPATRDEVARYAFNFYKNVVFVSYSKDKEDYEQKVVNSVAQTLAVQQGVKSDDAGVGGYVNGVASHVWKKN
ncbi:MAG TPA: S-layer homology domain-containing protein, partial [Papillibacter sp.]|nr:S-layer homology domain-containing protein [Papillibacter sp.]